MNIINLYPGSVFKGIGAILNWSHSDRCAVTVSIKMTKT